MPIRPENRDRYGPDWKAFSASIRIDRAGGQCECEGECEGRLHRLWKRLFIHGLEPSPRCPNRNGIHPENLTISKVVLTVAHLCHTPECRAHVKAMCQACHLNYDRAHHALTRAGSTSPHCPSAPQSSSSPSSSPSSSRPGSRPTPAVLVPDPLSPSERDEVAGRGRPRPPTSSSSSSHTP